MSYGFRFMNELRFNKFFPFILYIFRDATPLQLYSGIKIFNVSHEIRKHLK